MGTGYAILSISKEDGRFSPLSHHLPWYESKDEGFYAVWSDILTYCRYCHTEEHAVSDCSKNAHPIFIGMRYLVLIVRKQQEVNC